jgi:hypothetical protein
MARRALPALLAFVALCADLAGGHRVALVVLLAAVPAGFVLVLDCYADTLAARCGGGRPLLAAGSLALLVLSASLRSPAVVGGVPRAAVSALALGWMLASTACLLSVGRARVRVAVRRAREDARRDDRRLAA